MEIPSTGVDLGTGATLLSSSIAPTVKGEPASNSTYSIYCASEPGVVAAGARRYR